MTDTELVSTATAAASVGRTDNALGWDVAKGRVSPPVLLDGRPVWDLALLRHELGAYRPRCRRGPKMPSRAVLDAVDTDHARRRADRAADAAPVVREITADYVVVESFDGHRRYGSVTLGDTLTRSGVWLVETPSRAGYADTWDLPWAPTRAAALRMLLDPAEPR